MIGVHMITKCANQAHGYIVRVIPPCLIPKLISNHDKIIADGIFEATKPIGLKDPGVSE